MTHGSIFSGIGGFDLAALWCGWTNVFQCENDPFCQRVLKYFFSNTELHGNIKETNFTKYKGAIDVFSAGVPCQPSSIAGKRKGKADDSWLWDEAIRVLWEVRPTWAVFENPTGILSLVESDSEIKVESGYDLFGAYYKDTLLKELFVVEEIQKNIEQAGYSVVPVVIPACACGAPHRRDRVWIIAHSNWNDAGRYRHRETECTDGKVKGERTVAGDRPAFGAGAKRTAAYANGKLQEQRLCNGQGNGIESFHLSKTAAHTTDSRRLQNDKGKPSGQLEQNIPDWRDFPTQSPVCSRNDGFPGKLDGVTVSSWRRNSIRALGNAVVPQEVFVIYQIIDKLKL